MYRTVFAAVLLMATSNGLIRMTQAVGQTPGLSTQRIATLDSLRDRYRPMLIFTSSAGDSRFIKQREFCLTGAAHARERQVLFVLIVYRKDEDAGEQSASGELSASFSQAEASRLRHRFGIAPAEFTVVLIGKDGGEKFRTHTPVTMEKLNAVIDAMPMRQEEVRNGDPK